jgi:hypothetical protein
MDAKKWYKERGIFDVIQFCIIKFFKGEPLLHDILAESFVTRANLYANALKEISSRSNFNDSKIEDGMEIEPSLTEEDKDNWRKNLEYQYASLASAQKHYVRSILTLISSYRNIIYRGTKPVAFATLLVQWSRSLPSNEIDLLIARAVLQ